MEQKKKVNEIRIGAVRRVCAREPMVEDTRLWCTGEAAREKRAENTNMTEIE